MSVGTVLIEAEGAVDRRVPLAPSTVLGRHRSCTWRVQDERVPLYWVELRWFANGWAWRALADQDGTSGPRTRRANLPAEWRGVMEGSRIEGASATLVIESDVPPSPFAVDVGSGEVLATEQMLDLVDVREDGMWPLDAETHIERVRPLQDGQTVVVDGVAYRVHVPEAYDPTVGWALNIGVPSTFLYLDVLEQGARLTATSRGRDLCIEGHFVRAAAPYFQARLKGDGWLHIDEAHATWVALGGPKKSPRERVTQERSKVTRALASAGVGDATSLFETARVGARWATRLTVPADRLELIR